MASVASTGALCVSPSLMHTVALMPSSLYFAPNPPPWGPTGPKKRPLAGSTPYVLAMTRSAWCPAAVRSGTAGANALMIVSTMVMGIVIHMRIAAGFVALTTRPGGSTTFSGRNDPWLMGRRAG